MACHISSPGTNSNQNLLRGLRKTLVAPCHAVHFRDVIFADLLTSMSRYSGSEPTRLYVCGSFIQAGSRRGFTALESLYCIIQVGNNSVSCIPAALFNVGICQADEDTLMNSTSQHCSPVGR
jgi:hypothetical protein